VADDRPTCLTLVVLVLGFTVEHLNTRSRQGLCASHKPNADRDGRAALVRVLLTGNNTSASPGGWRNPRGRVDVCGPRRGLLTLSVSVLARDKYQATTDDDEQSGDNFDRGVAGLGDGDQLHRPNKNDQQRRHQPWSAA